MENVKDEQKVYGKIAKVLSVKLEVNSLDHDFKKNKLSQWFLYLASENEIIIMSTQLYCSRN